ncbi:MAG: MBOAT family protein [Clostridiales bacterium]|nr:MBOAT family protein [Clostridiales bacterium]
MSFASIDFICFFIIVLCVSALMERKLPPRSKEIFLLLASYFFYGYWDWRFCFLLLFVTTASYFTARFSDKKAVYCLGLITPLAVLGFFKYFNFFVSSGAKLFGSDFTALKIILPVGISFYTFQALSYVIDVHRGKMQVEKNFIKLAFYISFFPQLVAGPIVRASDFLPQLYEKDRQVSVENVRAGIQIFAFGLFKKIVLADHLSVFVDDVYGKPAAFNWATLLLAVLAYSMQIYFDFSGYSDMAIGCAKCLGYDFKKNFNLPYIAENVTDFWRRWHISLSTWLKEYLYIPLGGNRKGTVRMYLNLFLTMLLGGLWHGANWTFVVWGGLHGLVLCLDKLIGRRKKGAAERIFSAAFTFIFVSFMWIFFRSETFSKAWTVLRGIVTLQNGISQPFVWVFVSVFILLIATIAATVKAKKSGADRTEGFYPTLDLTTVPGLTLFFIAIGLIVGLAYTGENPFVYFQF